MLFCVFQPLKTLLNSETWNCNATSLNEGPRKTVANRCRYSSPRFSARTTMLLLFAFENFLGFHSQEISITLLIFFNKYMTGTLSYLFAKIINKSIPCFY